LVFRGAARIYRPYMATVYLVRELTRLRPATVQQIMEEVSAILSSRINRLAATQHWPLLFTGACNSEHMLGHKYSASGGQLDFVRGAFASKGGKSIIAARSTAATGKVSRIVPRLDGPVTTPRIDTHYIVTEFGAVNLKGLSSTERAHALIGLADPEFRDELTEAAKNLHLI
jgi:itaconate CoA-transferase